MQEREDVDLKPLIINLKNEPLFENNIFKGKIYFQDKENYHFDTYLKVGNAMSIKKNLRDMDQELRYYF